MTSLLSLPDTATLDAPAAVDYSELHCASVFSFLRAGSSVEALVARAAALGMPALALTDHMTLAGVVRFQAACAAAQIGAIVGVELLVAHGVFGAEEPGCVVALVESAAGYARLCQLLTGANLAEPDHPLIPFGALAAEPDGLIILTGGADGPLGRALLAGRHATARELAERYLAAFGPARLFIETQHHLLPESARLAQDLAARLLGLLRHLSLHNGGMVRVDETRLMRYHQPAMGAATTHAQAR